MILAILSERRSEESTGLRYRRRMTAYCQAIQHPNNGKFHAGNIVVYLYGDLKKIEA